uniref:Uncharacterized protein n=1 Tax=Setaria viridis TaxID=4556 RepID=A0A4U6T6X9_SETVI|nr:hypothetical protein SEVIR_9G390700v2 [Setaria viridis]
MPAVPLPPVAPCAARCRPPPAAAPHPPHPEPPASYAVLALLRDTLGMPPPSPSCASSPRTPPSSPRTIGDRFYFYLHELGLAPAMVRRFVLASPNRFLTTGIDGHLRPNRGCAVGGRPAAIAAGRTTAGAGQEGGGREASGGTPAAGAGREGGWWRWRRAPSRRWWEGGRRREPGGRKSNK